MREFDCNQITLENIKKYCKKAKFNKSGNFINIIESGDGYRR